MDYSEKTIVELSEKLEDALVGLAVARSHASEIPEIEAEISALKQELRKRLDDEGEVIHASDCAVNNEPAMMSGPCDCGPDEIEKAEVDGCHAKANNRPAEASADNVIPRAVDFTVNGEHAGTHTLTDDEREVLATGGTVELTNGYIDAVDTDF